MWSSSTDFIRQSLSDKSGYYWQVPKSFSAIFENVLCPVELTARIVHSQGCLIEFRILSSLPCFDKHRKGLLYAQPSQIFRVGERSVEREYEMFATLDNRFPALPDNALWVPLNHFVWNVVSWDASVILSCFVKLPGNESGGELWPSCAPKLRRTPGTEQRRRRQSRFGRNAAAVASAGGAK